MAIQQAEYIWLDGALPVQKLRSKTRMVAISDLESLCLEHFPEWSFDGSSTYQASGNDSDLLLKPVNFIQDPVRGGNNLLVLCEVMNPDGTPHSTNTRAQLRDVLAAGASSDEPWFGFEQEYTLMKGKMPLGFPLEGYPAPQGPYYCGVGADAVFGRSLIEAHTQACLTAGVMIYGTNAEVLPGQWEFQIGYRGVAGEHADPLTVADHLWFARWLLYRIAEDFNLVPSFAAKPVKGDWNGSGMHTNFSTRDTRNVQTGLTAINQAIKALAARHSQHIAVYGDGLAERLTGHHETCSIHEFRNGVADRGASIRLPLPVAIRGYGYLEDRRPAANADPYLVATRILETVCLVKYNQLEEDADPTPAREFWETGALSPFQQPNPSFYDSLGGDFIGE